MIVAVSSVARVVAEVFGRVEGAEVVKGESVIEGATGLANDTSLAGGFAGEVGATGKADWFGQAAGH